MRIVNVTQGSDEWHAWRARGISASDMPAILGISPYKSPFQLWAEKVGLVEPVVNEFVVNHGKISEEPARRGFEKRHTCLLLPVCAESDEDPLLRASFDGTDDEGRPVELKSPFSQKVFNAVKANGRNSDPFLLYLPQVQTQLLVTGGQSGVLSFSSVDKNGTILDVEDLEVERDDQLIAQIRETGRKFWELVRTMKPPKLHPSVDVFRPVADDERRGWEDLAAIYRPIRERERRMAEALETVQRKRKELDARFVQLMGPYARAEHVGVSVSRFVKRGAVNIEALLWDAGVSMSDEDLDDYREDRSYETRVTVR